MINETSKFPSGFRHNCPHVISFVCHRNARFFFAHLHGIETKIVLIMFYCDYFIELSQIIAVKRERLVIVYANCQ